MQKHCIKSSSNICFGYLLESPQRGDSNKYPKHMFYEKIRIKQGLSYISFCPLRILYNSKFIIMKTFLGTNAVVVKRVHCNTIKHFFPNAFCTISFTTLLANSGDAKLDYIFLIFFFAEFFFVKKK